MKVKPTKTLAFIAPNKDQLTINRLDNTIEIRLNGNLIASATADEFKERVDNLLQKTRQEL